jgi:hypothetical protein
VNYVLENFVLNAKLNLTKDTHAKNFKNIISL